MPNEPDHLLPDSSIRKSSWQRTTFILLSDVMGIGVLSLPYSISKLGWVVGVSSLILICIGNAYTCQLLARCTHARSARTYADIAGSIGPRAHTAAFIVCSTFLAACVAANFLVATIALKNSLAGVGVEICMLPCGCILAVAVLPVVQTRVLHNLGCLGVIGTLCIVVPLLMVLANFATADAKTDHGSTHIYPTDSFVEDTIFEFSIVLGVCLLLH
jgi:hypothetical protein